ncbi:hypothetical protein [Burkholderia cenocepacia]|uniref:hypothetical protein n=1 Tax=Burkholderia cenocepacia TaxID=95486 RepID=UPI002AB775E0|nr:hypothetical protein [Burkholderia cenocepacia]
MSFHSGTANNLPGFDGYVQLSANVGEPPFNSLWELSTQSDTRAKIFADVKKSFKRDVPAGWVKADTVYVAVTLRKLSDPGKLEQEIAALSANPWSYVRVVDAPALVQWIEKCPAVEAWCAGHLQIGTGVFGFSLERYWRDWSTGHKPAISPQLVTAGRSSSQLDASFKPRRGETLTLLTDSAAETAAYLYAYLEQSEDRDGALKVLANCLVVSSLESARALALEPVRDNQVPVTVLLPPANDAALTLANAGHFVVNAIGYAAPSNKPIVIRRALRRDFSDALQNSMGMAPERAEQEARACGASVSVWSVWNKHGSDALGQLPEWCGAEQVMSTVPAVFASRWDESTVGDTEVMESLSGVQYRDFLQRVVRYMDSDPPLLERAGSVLSLVAPTVAFALTARSISSDMLRALEQAIESVFSRVSISEVTAWEGVASFPMEAPRTDHSTWLRDGLLETILRISAFKEVLDRKQIAHAFGGCQAFVDKVVERIAFFRDEPRFFAALSENLPLMAEAAPVPFVEALEQALQGFGTGLAPLFEDKGFFGPVLHSGLMSALECLAWEPAYFAQVVRILAQLTQFEADGRVVNKPSNSLRSIFLAWNPCTSAPLAQRMDALRTLAEEFPSVAWQLAGAILPKHSDTSFSSYEPVWKDFGRSSRQPLTDVAIRESYVAYVDFALALSRGRVERQLDLLDGYPLFSPAHRQAFRDQLALSAQDAQLSTMTREALWSGIRQLVAKHRRFSNAAWALASADVDELESVGRLFQPASEVAEVQWLFDDYLPDLPNANIDIEDAQVRAGKLRDEAMQLLVSKGLSAVDELYVKARQPYLVAQQAAVSIEDTGTLLQLLDLWLKRNSPRDERGAATLCAVRYAQRREDWLGVLQGASVSRGWPDGSLGACVADLPDEQSVLNAVAGMTAAAATRYWSVRGAYLRSDNTAINDEIARKLVECHRAAELINQSLKKLSVGMAIVVLEAAVRELQHPHRIDTMLGYSVKESIKWLRAQPQVPDERLDAVEHSFLPVLLAELHDGEQLTFHKTMAERPESFIAILCDVYRPAKSVNMEGEREPITPEAERRATVAWRVLRSWRTPPGVDTTNRVQYEAMMDWISRARRLAGEEDRAAIADQYIGAVLLHTPGEADGRWPSDGVARVLEELQSKALEDGLSMEVVNSRGTTSRGIFDGGKQEKEIAEQWASRAAQLSERWRRAKRLCRRIADSWVQMANEFDVEAAKRRLNS